MSRVGRGWTESLLSKKGFTLIELVIVMVIVGLITTLTLPVFSKSFYGLGLRKSVQELRSAVRYSRGEAIINKTPKWLAFDIEEEQYWFGDGLADEETVLNSQEEDSIRLPDGVDLDGFSWFDGSDAERVGWVQFYPNGSSSGGSLSLGEVYGERMARIVMEPFTGLSRVETDTDE